MNDFSYLITQDPNLEPFFPLKNSLSQRRSRYLLMLVFTMEKNHNSDHVFIIGNVSCPRSDMTITLPKCIFTHMFADKHTARQTHSTDV